MKAFIAAILGIVVISVGAKMGLDSLGMSSNQTFSMDGVSPPPAPVDRAGFE